jgi:DNA modification methylase
MTLPVQLDLFDEPHDEEIEAPLLLNRANLGTFQESLRAPIHRWFTYPAGFSFRAVEEAFRLYQIEPGKVVYDPFAGTGTTNVVAKQAGVDSFGVEAHPFVCFVARTKLFWEFDLPTLHQEIDQLITHIRELIRSQEMARIPVETLFPELVCKCYSREKLARLYLCREAITALPPGSFRDFAKLGLTALLRSLADVATGWPYIAPQKAKQAGKTSAEADVAEALRRWLYQMSRDVQEVSTGGQVPGRATIIEGDARQRQDAIETASVDLAFTSPPYLNNYDYSDRTRLEMYFWDEARTWGDITQKVRTRLMMSATTQINRSDYDEAHLLSEELVAAVPQVAAELRPKIAEMAKQRLVKGGKKSYDIMVAGYFNDMFQVFRETFRVLEPGAVFVLILGDSAPYGVYVPTDVYLGEIGKAVGFARCEVEELRTRGGKWKENPQRHKVPLKECILTLQKR